MEQILIWGAVAVVAIWVSFWVFFWVFTIRYGFNRHTGGKGTARAKNGSLPGWLHGVFGHATESSEDGRALSSEMRRDDSGR